MVNNTIKRNNTIRVGIIWMDIYESTDRRPLQYTTLPLRTEYIRAKVNNDDASS